MNGWVYISGRELPSMSQVLGLTPAKKTKPNQTKQQQKNTKQKKAKNQVIKTKT